MLGSRSGPIYFVLAVVVSFCLPTAEPTSSRLSATEAPSPATDADSVASHRRLIDRHCVACHNQRRNVAGLNLAAFDLSDVAQDAEVWEKVVHKVRTGDMPPAERRQPSAKDRDGLLSWLTATLDAAAATDPKPGRPAVHRLNRAEYANAIRDLLALEIDDRSLLPADGSDYGFDNIADSLNMSPLLLERYLMAASKISRLAVGDPDLRPSSRTYKVRKLLLQSDRMGEQLPFGSRGGIAVRHHFPLDGEYAIKVNVESPRSDQPQDLFQRSEAPEQLDVRVDGKRVGVFNVGKPKSSQWSYAKNGFAKDVPEEERADADWWGARTLEVRFPAKAGTRTVAVSFLKRTLAYEGIRPRALPAFYDYLGLLRNVEPGVIDFEVAGPYDATGFGDSQSRRRIFVRQPSGPDDEEPCATEILSTLARRAYRRPLTDEDLQTLMHFYELGYKDGGFEAGIQWGLERILVSPSFLFRVEADPPDVSPNTPYELSDLELASRLSFFLWSSIPDDELHDLAQRGKLNQPAVLEHQVRRMLADPRSESLVTSFATQWLYLRNVDAVTPDVNLFPDFDDSLRDALRRETELFFSSQLREDQSVLDLLRADYTFLNERLAQHYGIPNIYGSHFRRVDLHGRRLGGLLGQGSILTVTSYATRTSPVKRGKWLLENILGSPPPPPPPDVPDLPETGESGEAATLRERMELHVANPGCASCHVKMDPLGFSLENFDAIGKWRSTAEGGLPVDSHGELPDGTVLAGPAGLRDVLIGKDEEFVTTAIKKLLTYALGRGIDYHDQPAVRQILRAAARDDYRWSSVILGIVNSTPFRMRESGP